MGKVTPFLMFNDQLEAAMKFYTTTFPDSKVLNVSRAGKNGPVAMAEFIVGGQHIMAYNGGPHFSFSPGVSMFVMCEDQKEVDTYWNKILKAGGKEQMCGWISDPFGLSWQIIPKQLMQLRADKDPKKAKAVIDAMLQMVKIDVKALETAHREGK